MSQPMVGDGTGRALSCLPTQTVPGFFDLMKSPPSNWGLQLHTDMAVLEQEKQPESGHFVPLDIQWQLPRDAHGGDPTPR